jgi:hypothetical protein
MQEPGTSSWRWRELRRAADSGICWGPSSGVTREDIHELTKKQRLIRESVRGPSSGVTREDIHEPTKKQSQSCFPRSPGFECELVADL